MPKPDIVAVLDAYDAWLGRHCAVIPATLARKRTLMAADPFAFLRGTAFRFAGAIRRAAAEAGGDPLRAILRRRASGEFRHLAGCRRTPGLGRQRPGRGGHPALRRRPRSAGDQRPAGAAPHRSAFAGYRGDTAARLCRGTWPARAPSCWTRRTRCCAPSSRPTRRRVPPSGRSWRGWSRRLRPVEWQAALKAALPAGAGPARFAPREAGLGSLGRPRFVAIAEWRGGQVVREGKARVASAWVQAGFPGAVALDVAQLATCANRAPDPWFRLLPGLAIRRLAPDSRKLEAPSGDPGALLTLLEAMGGEIGNLHAAGGDGRPCWATSRPCRRTGSATRPRRWSRRCRRIRRRCKGPRIATQGS